MHPRALARKIARKREDHRYRRSHTGLPCAVVYGLWRALPGEPCRLPPSSPRCSRIVANLAPAFGAPGPHAFARPPRAPLVSQHPRVHRSPASRLVTIAMRPSCWRRDADRMLPICRNCKKGYLRQIGTTGNLRMGGMRERSGSRAQKACAGRRGPDLRRLTPSFRAPMLVTARQKPG